jgi:uncharacterized protein
VTLPIFGPTANETFAPFWTAVEEGVLRLPTCSVCLRWQWYPEESGTCCDAGELRWVDVAGRGVVHTCTRVRRAFLPGTTGHEPFTVALIELDEAPGLRLVSNIDDENVQIGDRVDIEFVNIGERKHPVFHRIDVP